MKETIKKLCAPVLLLLGIAVYILIILLMKDRMPGSTYINGKNVSFMTYDTAAKELTEDIAARKISLKNGEEVIGEIDAKEYATISIKEETLKSVGDKVPLIDRLLFFAYGFHYDIEPQVVVNKESINSLVKEFGGTDVPSNAYVARKENTSEFVIIPEKDGNMIDSYTAEDIITKAIEDNKSEAYIDNAFIKAGVLSSDERLIKKRDKLNIDFADMSVKFVYKNGVSTKTTVLKDEELFSLYQTDEYGVPYISESEEYEIDSKLAKEYVNSIVPEDYEEYIADAKPSVDGDKDVEAKGPDKTVDKAAEKSQEELRDEKVSELTEWLIETLAKCRKGNKTF